MEALHETIRIIRNQLRLAMNGVTVENITEIAETLVKG